jgi:two-component system OmpR family sensor kinase
MSSLRARLTTQYSLVLAATVTVFAASVYVAHDSTVTRTAVAEGAARAGLRAELALRILRRESATGEKITVTPEAQFNSTVRELLDVIPGYLIVVGPEDRILFQSLPVKQLGFDDANALGAVAQHLTSATGWTEVDIGRRSLLLVARRDEDPTYYGQYRVVSGLDYPDVSGSSFFEVVGSLVIALPLLIGLSIGGAWFISGRALEALDRVTTEVTAITDGRSLHRRLPLVSSNDELARLTVQLNSMISRLETSFGALRRFTADASHELKTPLTVLRADLERALRAPANSTEQLVALEEALQETARMGDLVESLLTLARADEGRFDILRERVSLEAVAREVLETAVILGEGAAVSVSMPIVQDCVVLGDRTRLRQLFLNLVMNGIKYTPPGGDVELNLIRSDTEASFSVRDTGIGIAAADMPYIFERFWRADRVRSRGSERGGFGLGLSISQWIAQAHGGSLTAQSRLHRGSTFTVTLPLAPRGEEAASGAIAPSGVTTHPVT